MKRLLPVLALIIVSLVACKASEPIPPDVSNGTYILGERRITLALDLFEEPVAPGSAAKASIRLLNARAIGDLDGDGKLDASVVLAHNPGGSGTFYYLAAYLGDGNGGGVATPAIPLGDRVAIEAVGIASSRITLRVLDRKPGEPFSTEPSVRVTRVFEVKAGALSEVK